MRRFLTALLIALCCVCFAVGLTACGGNNGNGGNSGSTINGGGGSWGGWGGKPGNNGGGKQPGNNDPFDNPDAAEEVVFEDGFTIQKDAELRGYVVVDYGRPEEWQDGEDYLDIPSEYMDIPIKAIDAPIPQNITSISLPDNLVRLHANMSAEEWFGENPNIEHIYTFTPRFYNDNDPDEWSPVSEDWHYLCIDGVLYERNDYGDIYVAYVCAVYEDYHNLDFLDGITSIQGGIGTLDFHRLGCINYMRIPDSVISLDAAEFYWGEDSSAYFRTITVGANLNYDSIERLLDYSHLLPYGTLEAPDNPNFEILCGINYLKKPDGGKTLLSFTNNLPDEIEIVDNSGLTPFMFEGLLRKIEQKEGKTSIVLPSEFTEIDDWECRNLTKLKSISGAGIIKVGYAAFEKCTGLESVSFPKLGMGEDVDNTNNQDYYFERSAFCGCTSLKSVSFPEALIIRYNAFDGCTALTSAYLPKVKYIDSQAFYGCASLQEADFEAVKSIGGNAFYGCTSLTRVNFPNAIEVWSSAFNKCTSLATVYLPSVYYCGNWIFGDAGYATDTSASITDFTASIRLFEGLSNMAFANLATLTVVPQTYNDEEYTTASSPSKIPSAKKVIYAEGITGIRGNSYSSSNVEEVVLPSTLTVIGDYAFKNCNKLESVNLTYIQSIGQEAFDGCTALTELSFPETLTNIGYYAFNGCTGINALTFNSDVTLGSGAFRELDIESVIFNGDATLFDDVFRGCEALSSVVFGGQADVGNNAFYNCTALTAITFNGETKLGIGVFSGCSELEEIDLSTVAEMGGHVFYGCEKLSSVVLGDIEEIGEYAFYGCSSLASFDFDGVKKIYNNAFQDTALTTIDFKTVEYIGYEAFWGSVLISIDMPNVEHIEDKAFDDSHFLNNISIGDNIKSIGRNAFASTAFRNNSDNYRDNGVYLGNCLLSFNGWSSSIIAEGTTLVAGGFLDGFCGTIILPSTLKYISDGAFANYDNSSIIIPDGVKAIGDRAFYKTGLENIIIPGSVEKIGYEAFYEAKELKNVVISEGVKEIGEHAFNMYSSYNAKLTNVVLPASIERVGKYAFSRRDTVNITLYYGGTEAEWNAVEKTDSHLPDEFTPTPSLEKALGAIDDGNYTVKSNGSTYMYADGRVDIDNYIWVEEASGYMRYELVANNNKVSWVQKESVYTPYSDLLIMKKGIYGTFFNGDEFTLTFTDDGIAFIAAKAVDMGAFDVIDRTITAIDGGYLFTYKISGEEIEDGISAEVYAIGETEVRKYTDNPIDLFFMAIDYYKNYTQDNVVEMEVNGNVMYYARNIFYYAGNKLKLTSINNSQYDQSDIVNQWLYYDGVNYNMYQQVGTNPVQSGTIPRETFMAFYESNMTSDTRYLLFAGDNYEAGDIDGVYSYIGDDVYMEAAGERVPMSHIVLEFLDEGNTVKISGDIGGVMEWSYTFRNINETAVSLPA